jgi:hypothetical protein
MQSHQNSSLFSQKQKLNSKILIEAQYAQIAKAILSKKSNAGGTAIADFKFYYRAMVATAAWCCHEDTRVDQWDRSRNKSTKLEPFGFYQRCQKHILEKRQLLLD